jgi:hypothetical protein
MRLLDNRFLTILPGATRTLLRMHQQRPEARAWVGSLGVL